MPYLYGSDFYGYHTGAILLPVLWAVALTGHAAAVWKGGRAAPSAGSQDAGMTVP